MGGMVDQWVHSSFSSARFIDLSCQTSTLTRILLTYRQFIFVTVYSHLLRELSSLPVHPEYSSLHSLVLDHSSQVWWRWVNMFFTLTMWSIEMLVAEDDPVTKEWKVD